MKIIVPVIVALFLVGCSEESKKEPQKAKQEQTIVKDVKVEEPKVVEKVVKKEPVIEVDAPAKEVVDEKIATVQEATSTKVDAKTIYKACASCHGANGEKAALNKSKIIKDMSKADVAAALHGYKDGTYGGPMRGLMKGQVGSLSDADITAIAEKIGK